MLKVAEKANSQLLKEINCEMAQSKSGSPQWYDLLELQYRADQRQIWYAKQIAQVIFDLGSQFVEGY